MTRFLPRCDSPSEGSHPGALSSDRSRHSSVSFSPATGRLSSALAAFAPSSLPLHTHEPTPQACLLQYLNDNPRVGAAHLGTIDLRVDMFEFEDSTLWQAAFDERQYSRYSKARDFFRDAYLATRERVAVRGTNNNRPSTIGIEPRVVAPGVGKNILGAPRGGLRCETEEARVRLLCLCTEPVSPNMSLRHKPELARHRQTKHRTQVVAPFRPETGRSRPEHTVFPSRTAGSKALVLFAGFSKSD